ncbi:HAMP domain-containing histidine kinase [Ramlibacter sp. XY19]|uniref:sensor histidine kinase n=1 Tax=Ramlibacter paludis TaxID=2908000 RepID=UPI0023DC6511|nr:HAMP domain-containing sensor histidine kinase [Ramlibacter paludis]MCG2592162.1 HAMP domain-containing histidine kinase [Ramlibacter paludis]
MKMDLPPAAASIAETQWVEGELVRYLMRTQRSTQWVGVLLIAIVVVVLWGDGARWPLLVWAFVGVAVACIRMWVISRYEGEVVHQNSTELVAFFERYRWVFPASALVWGLGALLYFDRSSLADQFICWLIIAGLAMFSINIHSSHRATMAAYLNTLAITTLGVMAWRMGFQLRFQGPSYHWWVVALLATFWQVLLQAGARLHVTLRRNFELQYRNNQLIDSLTRQTQAALDAVEIKNRFLASAAHDIRQPVHALGLYADWLGSEPELVHELAPKIVESTKAVNQLFDSLFDLARLDSGKIRLNIETVNVAKLLHDLELQYRPLCEAKGLQFRLHVQPGTAISDPILLQRIVGNLIANAVKYTQRGGILVASRTTREGLRIEIWDTGVGIAPVHQREIFREFYKVPSHAGTEDGFGLGLYIVGRLTGILGHTLTLRSRVGRGTVFRLALHPTDPQAASERAVASIAQMLPERPRPV